MGHPAEKLVREFVQRIVVYGPGRAEHDARGGVILGAEALEVGGGVALDGARRAKDRAAERLVRIGLFESHVEGYVVRAVLRGRDFLQDYLALAIHLVVGKRRIQQKVADQAHAEFDIAAKHARVIVRRFGGSHRVERATGPLDLLGDLHGRARGRALERHVLKEMRDTMLVVRFGPRARIDEHAHGRGFKPGHPVAYDPETVAKLAYLDRHNVNLR